MGRLMQLVSVIVVIATLLMVTDAVTSSQKQISPSSFIDLIWINERLD